MTTIPGNRFQRGTNQAGMRAYNERLVLSLLRRHGAMAKSDIARLTGLSAQTVSVIMRALEQEELLQSGEPVRIRGKVGQPSVPLSLNPSGAYFFGLKLGRRSSDLILIDFVGEIIASVHQAYAYPTPDSTVQFCLDAVEQILRDLAPEQSERIAGLGICMPYQLWEWVESSGAPARIMDEWKSADIRALVAARCDYPVYLQNDATAACGAELVFGQSAAPRDFLYFYIGYFIGGGVVLNGNLFTGRSGNAGALGSMPILGADGCLQQLIDVASLAALDRALRAADEDPASLWSKPDDWRIDPARLGAWIEAASRGIAQAIVSSSAVIDFEEALIDGWLPADARAALVAATTRHLAGLNSRGIDLPRVAPGSIGPSAREMGAASLPLSLRFMVDQSALLKSH